MSMSQHGLEAPFFPKKGAKVQHRRYAILKRFLPFARVAGKASQSLYYLNSHLDSSCRNLLRIMLSTFEGQEALKEKSSRTLWDSITSAGDKRREERKRDAGRAGCTQRRKLVVEFVENTGEIVWASETRAALELWLGWLASLLSLEKTERRSCSFPSTGKRLLLSGKSVKT